MSVCRIYTELKPCVLRRICGYMLLCIQPLRFCMLHLCTNTCRYGEFGHFRCFIVKPGTTCLFFLQTALMSVFRVLESALGKLALGDDGSICEWMQALEQVVTDLFNSRKSAFSASMFKKDRNVQGVHLKLFSQYSTIKVVEAKEGVIWKDQRKQVGVSKHSVMIMQVCALCCYCHPRIRATVSFLKYMEESICPAETYCTHRMIMMVAICRSFPGKTLSISMQISGRFEGGSRVVQAGG